MSNNDINTHIATRLKLIRSIREMSLSELAARLGISRKQAQNYETIGCAIPISRLFQLAQTLNVTTSYFLDGLETNTPIFNNEDLELVKSFHKIKDPAVKNNLRDMIISIAER